MYFEKLTRKRDTLIQSIRMSESQPEIFNEVSNFRFFRLFTYCPLFPSFLGACLVGMLFITIPLRYEQYVSKAIRRKQISV